MNLFLIVIHVVVAIFLTIVILVQPGKGGGLVMGGGGSNTLFGTTGAGNFLTKLTTALVLLFVVTSVMLTKLQSTGSESSLFDQGAAATPIDLSEPAVNVPKENTGAAKGAEQPKSGNSNSEPTNPGDSNAEPTKK